MRRTLILTGAVTALLAGGCRHSCNDRPRLFDRLSSRAHDEPHGRLTSAAPCCPDATAATARTAGLPGYSGSFAHQPDVGFGFPSYPNGTPFPVVPGGAAPGNELPYPRIPAPGVPEGPAQPSPAIPTKK